MKSEKQLSDWAGCEKGIDLYRQPGIFNRRMATQGLPGPEHREKQDSQRAMLGIPLTDDDLVFSQPDGKPLRPDSITHAWIKLVKCMGLKGIRLHDARHSHASLIEAAANRFDELVNPGRGKDVVVKSH